MGLVDQPGEGHQQARHQQKHRAQAEQNGLDQHHADIVAQLILHEAQGQKAGYRGEAAGGDLRYGLAQSGNGRLSCRLVFVLLHIAVAENNGVVNGQGQLEHDGDGVGHKGDLPHQVVGAHVQNGRRAEGDEQYGDLRVGLGGEQQHKDDDHHGDDVHHQHLVIDDGFQGIAHGAADIEIVIRELFLHLFQGVDAHLVVLLPVEGDGKQGGGRGIVAAAVVKFHGFYALGILYSPAELLGLFKGDILHHDLCGAEGGKFPLHQLQPLAGLGILREIVGQAVVHLDPVS